VRSPIKLETLLKKILKDLKGIKPLGRLIIARVPNPITNSNNININVIKPIRLDLTLFILVQKLS
jgi:hypothetical protein